MKLNRIKVHNQSQTHISDVFLAFLTILIINLPRKCQNGSISKTVNYAASIQKQHSQLDLKLFINISKIILLHILIITLMNSCSSNILARLKKMHEIKINLDSSIKCVLSVCLLGVRIDRIIVFYFISYGLEISIDLQIYQTSRTYRI